MLKSLHNPDAICTAEGLESSAITIDGGDIHVISRDDGVNVAGGNDGSGMMPGQGPGGQPGQGPGQDAFTYSGDSYLRINGAVEMTDGIVLVNAQPRT